MGDEQATAAGYEDGLTEQERRVALAVGQGKTNKATARELGITIKTVEFHLSNIYRKLAVDGRAGLAHVITARLTAEQSADQVLARARAIGSLDDYDSIDAVVAALVDGYAVRRDGSPVRNPYKGLRSFREADAADFFGRERLVDRITTVVARNRFVTVVGPSGSGKSSVVHAGLVPALRAGAVPGAQDWLIASMTPGATPLDAWRAAQDAVMPEPPRGPAGNGDGAADATSDADGEDDEVLLIVDQLEELYTLGQDEVRDSFVTRLVDAVSAPGSRLRVVATLRADFYDRPLRDPRLAPLLGSGAVTVPPLTDDELHRAIVEPARRAGTVIEPGLAAQLAADVRAQPGALPLMQYALTEVYERSEAGRLQRSAYDGIGGLREAIARRAEELYGASGEEERAATRRLFTRLVSFGDSAEDTRRRVRVGELDDAPATASVLAGYGLARLLTFDQDALHHEATVELAHDALIGHWPRLRTWLDEDRDGLRLHRDLTLRAGAWQESGDEAGDLYRGGRLEAAEQWAAEHQRDLNAVEADFLAASVAQRRREHEAEQRNIRRIKRGLVLVAAVAVLALVAGAFAWRQQQSAESAARTADRERDAARAAEFASETGRLAALAPTLAETNPALSLLLAAEAEQRFANPDTWGALQQVLVAADAHLGFLPSKESLRGAFFDGDALVGVGQTQVTIWDATAHVARATFDLPVSVRAGTTDYQIPLDIAAGTLVWVGVDDRAHALDLASGAHEIAPLADADEVALDESGDRLAVVNRNGDVAMYRLPGMEELWITRGPGSRTFRTMGLDVGVTDLPPEWDAYVAMPVLAFGPGDETLAVARGFSVATHDAADGVELASAPFPMIITGLTVDEATSPRLLAMNYQALSAADLPTLTNVANASHVSQLPVPDADLAALPDGRLAVLSTQGHIRVLAPRSVTEPAPPPSLVPPPATVTLLETLDSHVAGAHSLDLGPDGTTLLVAGDSGAALVSASGSGLMRRAVPRPPDHVYYVGGRNGTWVGSAPNISSAAQEDLHLERSESLVWDCDAQRCGGVPTRYPATQEISVEPDRDLLVVFDQLAMPTGTWQYFDGTTRRPASPAIPPETRIGTSTAIAPDRQWVLLVNAGTSLTTVELATGRELSRLPLDGGNLPGAAALPGRDAALVFDPITGDSFVLDVMTGQREPSPLPAGEAGIVVFSRTGALVATADPSGEVVVRDGGTLEVLHRLAASETLSSYLSMAFSDDDRFLLTVHPTGGRLWDVASGQLIGARIPTAATTAPGALPGTVPHLITASDQWVQLWDLDVDRWGELACTAAGRNLTRQEWQQVGPRDQDYRATCPQWPIE